MQTGFLISFGAGGNAASYQQAGWSQPEDGFTWSVGSSSLLLLGLPADWPRDRDAMLEITLHPLQCPRLGSGRLGVAVNGALIGQESLDGWCTLGYRVPAEALQAGSMLVELQCPDARSPSESGLNGDGRVLGMMVRSLVLTTVRRVPRADTICLGPWHLPGTEGEIDDMLERRIGLKRRELAQQFESLGQTCEFGLVQFHLGQARNDPAGISLLRFGGIELPRVIAGLRERFARVGEDVEVRVDHGPNGPTDLMIRDRTYDFSMHSFEPAHLGDPDKMRREAPLSLKMRRRMLLERMENAERIFVFKQPGLIRRAQVLPLVSTIRDIGNARLLYVDQSGNMPNGAVEQIEDGLFHGKVDRMAPRDDAGESDVPAWISVLANAVVLSKRRQRFQ